jgi:hypothetical protein
MHFQTEFLKGKLLVAQASSLCGRACLRDVDYFGLINPVNPENKDFSGP